MDYYVVVDHWFFICIFLLDICMKDPSSLKNESLKGRVLSLRNRTAGPDEEGIWKSRNPEPEAEPETETEPEPECEPKKEKLETFLS